MSHSLVTGPPASKHRPAPSSLTCTWEAGSCAAWVHVAGELDLAGSQQLEQALGEAGLDARLVVLDLRDLTFIDSCGVRVILDAARNARQVGGRLMLARGTPRVDRVLTLTGVSDELLILEVDPTGPFPALQYLSGDVAA
jgi:anti-anti-sigma factor